MASLSYLNCVGSSFDDFLKEEGIFEECDAEALKRIKQMEENFIKNQLHEYAIKIDEKLDSILDEK